MKQKRLLPVIIIIILVNLMSGKIVMAQINDENIKYNVFIKEGEKIVVEKKDFDIIELYNCLYINMNDIFSNLFGDDYKVNEDITINYKDQAIDINSTNNTMTLSDIYEDNNSKYDNSVEVEIENINNKKYVPIYLISNLPGIIVKIDEKIIYSADNYCSSIDAISNLLSVHKIEISINNIIEEDNNLKYKGQQDGALWREEAYKRIEKYRKKDIKLIVKDQNGKVINNAEVNIKMTNNNFCFGTAIRSNSNYESNNYEGVNRKLFNAILSENSMKWLVLNEEGTAPAKDVSKYAQDNDMIVKGHTLWWDMVMVDELATLVGNKEEPEPDTMAYVYYEYVNDTKSEEMIQEEIERLKEKFEDIIYNHVKEVVRNFPEIKQWDVVNEISTYQYFKYYLYNQKFLTDESFMDSTKYHSLKNEFNEDYDKFIAKCFELTKEASPNSVALINDCVLNGNLKNINLMDEVSEIKQITKFTNNVDAIGFQYHVGNIGFYRSPQAYYNNILNIMKETGINNCYVTEYDTSKNGDANIRAKYLRDSLISIYSNQNMDGFYFWVYGSNSNNFSNEEKIEYETLMKEWLNYSDIPRFNEKLEGYYSCLYKGSYTASIRVDNLETVVNFDVDDKKQDIIQVVINIDYPIDETNDTNKREDKTTANTNIPQTGEKILSYIFIIVIIFALFSIVRYIILKRGMIGK